MTQAYFDPSRECDPHALPDCEIFQVTEQQATENALQADTEEALYCAEPGWYWQACLPGCLPDGDPVGPFASYAAALADARASGDFEGGEL